MLIKAGTTPEIVPMFIPVSTQELAKRTSIDWFYLPTNYLKMYGQQLVAFLFRFDVAG